MKAKLSLLFAICFISLSAFAQTLSESIKHTVEPGQTLYFISKKYNLSVDELRKSNPEILEDLIIKPGQELQIPIKNVPTKVDIDNYKVHIVQTKETLFSISKMYNVTVDDLITMNNLENPNINIGQELKVQKMSVNNEAMFNTPTKEKKKNGVGENEVTMNENVLLYKQLFDSYNSPANTLLKDKGIGNYLDGNSTGAYLAMVNNVPAGQIVKVRNLMNNKVIYLKVVGPVSDKDAGQNISIKISKSAANDLNIIEDRFLSEWSWYKLGDAEVKPDTETNAPFDDF